MIASGISSVSPADIEGGHIYPDLVRNEPGAPKPIRVFLCDGRNDNRSLDADGAYNPKRYLCLNLPEAGGPHMHCFADADLISIVRATRGRDWFLQNVRMQQALEEKNYDYTFTWGVNLHGQKFGGAAMPEMMRWLWRDCTPVVTDPTDLDSREKSRFFSVNVIGPARDLSRHRDCCCSLRHASV